MIQLEIHTKTLYKYTALQFCPFLKIPKRRLEKMQIVIEENLNEWGEKRDIQKADIEQKKRREERENEQGGEWKKEKLKTRGLGGSL